MIRLGVNIDHVATIRNARMEQFPSVVEAGLIAESYGADLITVHLREDRRHIKDQDVSLLRQTLKTQLNLEMAATEEMLAIALKTKPDFVCLVPEKRHELTTEGGLDVLSIKHNIRRIVEELGNAGILTSLFVDPDLAQIDASHELGVYSVELHTGQYAKANHTQGNEFMAIIKASTYAHNLGLVVKAGHGINYHNVGPIANISVMNELNIGYAIIAQSVITGLGPAVSSMKMLMQQSRLIKDAIS